MRRNEMLERLQLWKAFHYSIDSRTRCSPTIDICRKLFWPADLAIFYPISKTYSSWQIGAALVLLIAISIAVYSSSAATHYNLGNVLMKVDRADEAIAHFAEAVGLDPQNPTPYIKRQRER